MLRFILVLAAGFLALSYFAPQVADELVARGRSAIVSVLAEPEPEPAPAGPTSTVRLRADRAGHYHADMEINGRRLRAVVDTGATLIALRYEDARELGLVKPGDRFQIPVRTANGTAFARRVELRSVRIGGITVNDVDAMVMSEGALGMNLLGMSFLKRLSRFEFKKNTLELER
jgi:aspartyl protease family protein